METKLKCEPENQKPASFKIFLEQQHLATWNFIGQINSRLRTATDEFQKGIGPIETVISLQEDFLDAGLHRLKLERQLMELDLQENDTRKD